MKIIREQEWRQGMLLVSQNPVAVDGLQRSYGIGLIQSSMPLSDSKPAARDVEVKRRSSPPISSGIHIPDWAKLACSLIVAFSGVSWLMFVAFIDRSLVPQIERIDEKVESLSSHVGAIEKHVEAVKTNINSVRLNVNGLTVNMEHVKKDVDKLTNNADTIKGIYNEPRQYNNGVHIPAVHRMKGKSE